VTEKACVEDQLRQLAPQVLGALLRRHGRLDLCEDAVQEALLAASAEWAKNGVPDHPRGWLITVANRRLIDQVRSDTSRREREQRLQAASATGVPELPADDNQARWDDSLLLLFLCCHPALTVPAQIALTLRAVGGLTTKEIASAFFVPEATMAQRITRAKRAVVDAGATFSMPGETEVGVRLLAVMHVLYLIFNEGYTSSSGDVVTRVELTGEAIRLTRGLHRALPDDTEVTGLLALMLLTDARRTARTSAEGELIDLADQDRSLWDRDEVEEGVALVTEALGQGPVGSYQVQAAIAAVHDEAVSSESTDWPQVLALYELLDEIAPNPMASLNRAVALAVVRGPGAGLTLLASLDDDRRVAHHHRLYAVRGHLLEMAGDRAAACESFQNAFRRTTSSREKRYLQRRIDRLGG
jgi:RNA polymerase sigma factor (sigma-70 family)